MNITKEMIIYILNILKKDQVIEDYKFYKKENSIVVERSKNYGCKSCFKFNEKDNLINPAIIKIKKRIEELQEQLSVLEKEKTELMNKGEDYNE